MKLIFIDLAHIFVERPAEAEFSSCVEDPLVAFNGFLLFSVFCRVVISISIDQFYIYLLKQSIQTLKNIKKYINKENQLTANCCNKTSIPSYSPISNLFSEEEK